MNDKNMGIKEIKKIVKSDMMTKKLNYTQFYEEIIKLKKKAEKINKMSGNLMVLIVTRLKKYDNSKKYRKGH